MIQTSSPKIASSKIVDLLGDRAEYLLSYKSNTIDKSQLHLPSADHVDKIWTYSNRNNQVLRSMAQLLNSGRLASTGYCSIFPVDQGIEHSAGSAFAPNPIYFDPENIIRLAVESGCNAVASTYGVLGIMSRRYAHKIPFVVKINHNEFLSMPNRFDQTMFGTIKSAWNMGAVAIGATIYWGSAESAHPVKEVPEAFEYPQDRALPTILWCYPRNNSFKVDGVDYHTSAALTGQANHLGVTLQADIIKQKLPTNNGGYLATKHGKTSKLVYDKLTTDHPIDLCRYQVLNCFSGRVGLINSGGESKGESDMVDAITTAVINKRAGGMGLILGRKAFQRPFKEGVELLNAIQDVYLCKDVTVA